MKFPVDFKEKYTNLLGEDAPAFFEGLQTEPVKAFRVNPLKENYENIDYALDRPVPYVPTGFYGSVSGKSLDHQTGYVYSQEPSAMYVAEVGDIQPGEVILDLCAAPGGKSTQIATKLAGQGLLVSNEINRKRAGILAENIERIGATNVVILNESPQALAQKITNYFDKIFVDAPCSGEGMFRKDPDAIKYWHKDYPAECAARQREILIETMKMLKPGGQLIYSTCTFAPEEDEQIIEWLMENYELELVPVKKYAGMDSGFPRFAADNMKMVKAVRLFPHHFKGEGHFIARLQDKREPISNGGGNDSKKNRKKKKVTSVFRNLSKEEEKLWKDFEKEVFNRQLFNADSLRCWGDQLFYYSNKWPNIEELKFVKPGFQVGVFKKKRFEPAYGLALAIKSSDVLRIIDVTKTEWAEYVSGNIISLVDTQLKKGWYVLRCDGKLFAFAKLVNGTLKNFFPKGLRFTV
ncbi:RsmF rRNA methyltransferase first C-terminal domain-containing protein [Liquorilactobacillus mali]|uniref:23S rRNA m(5)C methyltransferase n=1 Tax=Liquorilactobacillus mali TaxID=1618 RepID=A0A0R2G097_9LACO|nr:RsmB/NOP family class I SAM-dependent RNA methyltransferase [Liquorilactobacillus mali]KRN33179.1 23S rRNA m(5)C methyltransferase [Liquorilactobacillus mali]MDN7145006.1 RsmF rRNA methyltransferase first C-terminal domain-containing protein [Liquorilactobacillus mali]